MTQEEFIDATGENPEDVFGSGWENIIDEMDSADNFDEAKYDALLDTYRKDV